ncbi:TPA: phage scaffold protein, partial [Streptococcus suis]|nr:phage scaffold protein [Streptococcus suis]HEM3375659.1 phage scaffold protein [Streptococcus suis]HEM3378163.1 phage scaffold protein [Streptococcus suis]HEM4230023.1 phage scaffold protein [Streptococcus suis]HEM4360288.1 phage scaffold protein [Streptococcus suis]
MKPTEPTPPMASTEPNVESGSAEDEALKGMLRKMRGE